MKLACSRSSASWAKIGLSSLCSGLRHAVAEMGRERRAGFGGGRDLVEIRGRVAERDDHALLRQRRDQRRCAPGDLGREGDHQDRPGRAGSGAARPGRDRPLSSPRADGSRHSPARGSGTDLRDGSPGTSAGRAGWPRSPRPAPGSAASSSSGWAVMSVGRQVVTPVASIASSAWSISAGVIVAVLKSMPAKPLTWRSTRPGEVSMAALSAPAQQRGGRRIDEDHGLSCASAGSRPGAGCDRTLQRVARGLRLARVGDGQHDQLALQDLPHAHRDGALRAPPRGSGTSPRRIAGGGRLRRA